MTLSGKPALKAIVVELSIVIDDLVGLLQVIPTGSPNCPTFWMTPMMGVKGVMDISTSAIISPGHYRRGGTSLPIATTPTSLCTPVYLFPATRALLLSSSHV